MVVRPSNEQLRREKSREAIALAMQSRWSEAMEVNRALLALFPDNVDAHNRLGKALSELGRYAEARQAFGRALQLQPHNAIARKNLERLAQLGDVAPGARPASKLMPRLFIEESSKSGLTVLRNPAPREILARMAAGDTVSLEVEGKTLRVKSDDGVVLGQVEPKLAARLIRFMEGGNRYVAALISVAEGCATVLIREVYQHQDLAGVVSFPQRGVGPSAPATELALPYGIDEEEVSEEHRPPPVPAWTDEDGEEEAEPDQEPTEEPVNAELDAGDEGSEEEPAL